MRAPSFDTDAPQRVVEPTAASAQVLARGKAPAVIRLPHGRGAWFYLSGCFVRQNFEDRAVSPRNATTLRGRFKYKVRFNADLNVLVRNLLDMAVGNRRKTRIEGAPRGVVYTAFVEERPGRRAVLIHLLNCQGKPDLRYGDTMSLPARIPQPPLPRDLVLRLRHDRPLARAWLVAPLRKGETQLALRRGRDGLTVVTIPAKALTNYAIVRVAE